MEVMGCKGLRLGGFQSETFIDVPQIIKSSITCFQDSIRIRRYTQFVQKRSTGCPNSVLSCKHAKVGKIFHFTPELFFGYRDFFLQHRDMQVIGSNFGMIKVNETATCGDAISESDNDIPVADVTMKNPGIVQELVV